MNINATIIFQAIHFGIAYLIFRFILLKPAYAAIVADNQQKEHLESVVADDKKRIERQQEEIAAQWRVSYTFFKHHTPYCQVASVVASRTAPIVVLADQLDMQQIIQMRRALSDVIVSSLGDRHDLN